MILLPRPLMRMHHLRRAALLSLLLLAACDGDAAELAREVQAARGDCTEEKLKAGDEACIQMMQRYAEMGTEAMRTYIGAVRSLDQALQRMPPPALDTTGLGHALSPGLAAGLGAEGDSGFAPSASRLPSSGARLDRGVHPRDGADGPWAEERGDAWDRRDARDDRYADPRDQGRYPDDPRAGWDDREHSPPPPAARGWEDPRGRPAPPGRGLLLPPEQRLERPWLRERDPRYREERYPDERAQEVRERDPRYRDPRWDGYLAPGPRPDSVEEPGPHRARPRRY